jgi:hypothetical protein
MFRTLQVHLCALLFGLVSCGGFSPLTQDDDDTSALDDDDSGPGDDDDSAAGDLSAAADRPCQHRANAQRQ